jgi:DNA-binding IclR family transcriptional regulator
VEAEMSNKPSSLEKQQAERLNERREAFGQTATALDVLCCFSGSSGGEVRRPTCSSSEIANTVGQPREAVDRQITRLIRLGYLELTPDSRFRLSERLLGETEIVAGSLRHSRTTARIYIDRGKGASSGTTS